MRRSQALTLLGLVLCSAWASTALGVPIASDQLDGPEVAPVRGQVARALKQAPTYGPDDLPGTGVDTGVPTYGEENGGGYYSPNYGPATESPGSPGSSPSPGYYGGGVIRSSFTATFAVSNPNAILNNPQTLAAFRSDCIDGIAQGLGIPISRVEWGRAYNPASSGRRSLLQDSLAIDYVVLYPAGTDASKIAEDRVKSTDAPGSLFNDNLLRAYALTGVTVTTGAITGGTPPPAPPGQGQSNTPPSPGSVPRGPAGSSASRTGVSVVLSALAVVGASMLMGML